MGRFFRFAFVAFVVAIILGWRASHFGTDDSQSSDDAASEAAAEAAAPSTYALDAARASWPPVADNPPPVAADIGAANYYVVLDASGSMAKSECAEGSTKMAVALAALKRFVEAVPAKANLGLAVFDEHGLSERVALAPRNPTTIDAQLANVEASGGTPLSSAMKLAYEQLTTQGRRQLGYGEYHLVMVTDGQPSPATEDPGPVVDEILKDSPVIIHTIGFCIGEDHVLNKPGRVLYTAADSPEQLQQGLSEVLAEAPAFDATKFSQ